LRKHIFTIFLSLALIFVLGVGSSLLAGNGCCARKKADASSCAMSSTCVTKTQAQGTNAKVNPADCCKGDPSKCANCDKCAKCDCSGKGPGKCECGGAGKCCQGQCANANCQCKVKGSTDAKSTTLGTATAKTVKTTGAKVQTASAVKGKG